MKSAIRKRFHWFENAGAKGRAGVRTYRIIADLAVLWHVELEADNRWRVAPPVLAALGGESEQSATAVLCGARTRGLVDRLAKACADQSAEMQSIAQSASGRTACW